MSDPATSAPIVVHGEPTQPQLEAAVRQTLLAVIPLFTALGMTKTAGLLTDVLGAAGGIATVGVFVIGQLITRRHAKQAAAMANMLPDAQAHTK